MIAASAEAAPVPAAAPAVTPTAAACELHVWPAPRMTISLNRNAALYRFPAKITPGDFDSHALLLPEVQNRVFAGMDLAQMLGMAGATVVRHVAPLPPDE